MTKVASRDLDIVDFFIETDNAPASRSTIASAVKKKLKLRKFAAGSLQYQLDQLKVGTLAGRGIVRVAELRIEGQLYNLDPAYDNVIKVFHEYYVPTDLWPSHIRPEQVTTSRTGMFFASKYSTALFVNQYFFGHALARYLNDWATDELEKLQRRLEKKHDDGAAQLAELAERICRYRQQAKRTIEDMKDAPEHPPDQVEKLRTAMKEADKALAKIPKAGTPEKDRHGQAWIQRFKREFEITETGDEREDSDPESTWRRCQEEIDNITRPSRDWFHFNFAFIDEKLSIERNASEFMSCPARRIMISDIHRKKLSEVMKISSTFLSMISSSVGFFRGDPLNPQHKPVDFNVTDTSLVNELRRDFTGAVARALNRHICVDRVSNPDLVDNALKRAGFKTLSEVLDCLDLVVG